MYLEKNKPTEEWHKSLNGGLGQSLRGKKGGRGRGYPAEARAKVGYNGTLVKIP